MSFHKALLLYQLFSLCTMFQMHLDNVSLLFNTVATPYVHLVTSGVTLHADSVYTAKPDIHMWLK